VPSDPRNELQQQPQADVDEQFEKKVVNVTRLDRGDLSLQQPASTDGGIGEVSQIGPRPSTELPSPDLMFRVAGTPDPIWFRKSGRRSIENITAVLSLIGKTFTDFPRALEFGCGCGRILLHLQDVGEQIDLHGVDIDAEAIGWAQQNVPWAKLAVNQGLPPLNFPDEHFDLIFNQSVFTHLDESYQDAWLVELERITKPGGVLILSVAGEHPYSELEKSWRTANADATTLHETWRSKGFVFIEDDNWTNGPFPDFYHSAFHAPWYIFERWGSIFDIKAYVVRGSLDFQDQLLMQRRPQRVGTVAPLENLVLKKHEQELEQSHAATQTWRATAEQWRAAAESSAGDVEKVLSSRSWRLTAPLRDLLSRWR
jgi:SAM-dependent methyltransferase